MVLKRKAKDKAENKAYGHLKKNGKNYIKKYTEFNIFQKKSKTIWKKVEN